MRNMEVVQTADGFLREPDYVEAVVLVANAAQSIPLPAGACFLIFSSEVEFFVAYGAGPATVPVATTANGGACEMNPTNRYVRDKTALSIIAKANGILTITMYAVQ